MHLNAEHINPFPALSLNLLCKLWPSQVLRCRSKAKKKKKGWSLQGLRLRKTQDHPTVLLRLLGFCAWRPIAVSRLPAWRDRACQKNMPRPNQETTVSRENSPPKRVRGDLGVLLNNQRTRWEWHYHSSSSYGSTWNKLASWRTIAVWNILPMQKSEKTLRLRRQNLHFPANPMRVWQNIAYFVE